MGLRKIYSHNRKHTVKFGGAAHRSFRGNIRMDFSGRIDAGIHDFPVVVPSIGSHNIFHRRRGGISELFPVSSGSDSVRLP